MNILKKYLSMNSGFSALTGLIMLFLTKHLNQFFQIDHPYVFPIIGINLLIFSAFVWYVSRKQLQNKMLVDLISGLDALWVLASFSIIIFDPFHLPKIALFVISIVAIWIGFLAYKQYQNN